MPKQTVIQSETFCRAIEAVHRCASKDETRPHINAVSIWVNGAEVKSAGTDGQMAAVYNEKQSVESAKDHFLLQLDDALHVKNAVKRYQTQFKHTPGGPPVTIKRNKRQKQIVLFTEQKQVLVGVNTVDEDFPPIKKNIPEIGRKPEFKDNFIGINIALVQTALQCFSAVGKSSDFLAWDFGSELDPTCMFKRYPDLPAELTIIIMPAKVDAGEGRAGE